MIVKVNLDSAGFNRGVTGLNRQMRMVNAEMRAKMRVFDGVGKSTDKLGAHLDGLRKKQQIQARVVEEARSKYERLKAEKGENAKATQQAAIALNREVEELGYLENQISSVESELARLKKQQEIQSSGWHKVGQSLEDVGGKMKSVGAQMREVGKDLSTKVTLPIVGLGAMSVKTGMDFKASMSRVAATSGATGTDLKRLEDKAREMGRTTQFSATESAEAMNYMAMAGWDANEMIDGIGGVMDLAAASGEDLATVSDIVTDGLTAFGMEAEESGKFADVLAATSANANTNVSMMGESFKEAAPVAGALGYSIEDTSLALGLMANSGIKGSKAGTALRNMMTNLAKPTDQMKAAMDDLDISLTDSEGSMKTFDEVMQDLRVAFSGLDEEQKAQYASTLFGKEAMAGALAVIDASETEYNDLSDAINNSEGAAKEMADVVNDNLKGSLKELASIFQDLAIDIYEILEPALMAIVDKLKQFGTWLNNLSPQAKVAMVAVAGIAASIGPLLYALGTLSTVGGHVFTVIGRGFKGIAKAGGALSLLTNPIGLTVGALALLGVGFYTLWQRSETFRNAMVSLGNGIKNIFSKVMDFLQPAIDAVVDFFNEKIQIIKEFWDAEGEQIMQSVHNIGTGVVEVLKFVGSMVQTAFTFILEVIQFIMPLVLFIIETVWGNIKGVISGALSAIMGIVQIFSGLFTGDFSQMWEGVKQLFFGAIQVVWNWINLLFIGRILKGITGFVGLFRSFLSGMWEAVKGIFMRAVKAVFNTTKGGFTTVLNITKTIFNAVKSFISTVWNAILNTIIRIVKSIWNGVKNVFTTLKNGVSNIFTAVFNIAKRIWNSIKTTVVTLARTLWNGVKNIFNTLKNGVSNIFSAVFNVAKRIWNTIKNTVVNLAKNLWNGVRNTFNRLKNGVSNIFSNVFNTAKRIWNNIKNTVTNLAKNLWNGVKNTFNRLKNGTKNLTTQAKNGIVNQWNKIKDNVKRLAKGMWDEVKKRFDNMVDGAKKLPGRIGDGIKNARKKATDAVKNMGNKMLGALEKPINGMIGGINWVTDKLGIKKKIDDVELKRYATGTSGSGHPGGPAIVGDGGRHELVTLPGGSSFISPNTDTLIPNMPKGTQVLPGRETEALMRIPQYKKGTWSVKGFVKGLGNKIKDVWSYATNPKKLVNKILKGLGVEGVKGFAKTLAGAGWSFVKKKPTDYIKGLFKKAEEDGGNFKGVASPSQVKSWISRAVSITGVPGSWKKPLQTIAMKESGGNPTAINLWDINAKRGRSEERRVGKEGRILSRAERRTKKK